MDVLLCYHYNHLCSFITLSNLLNVNKPDLDYRKGDIDIIKYLQKDFWLVQKTLC